MREGLKTRCDLFFEKRDAVKEAFKWENDSLISVCASVLMDSENKADGARMKECKAMLKEAVSVFSNFRGNVEMPMTALMAVSENPAELLAKTRRHYKALKEEFSGSEYLVLAAAILAEHVAEEEIGTVVVRAKKLYKMMKEEHPFLTSSEDSVFAVLMAISDKPDEATLIAEAEVAYKKLKETFSSSNDVQTVAFILALAEGNMESKCEKLTALYGGLRAAGEKYGKYYELANLATLSLLPMSVETMVADITAVANELAQKKPYSGILGLDRKTELMHATLLVSGEYAKSGDSNIAAMTSTLAMIAAQQAALCAAICASAAASSAAAAN